MLDLVYLISCCALAYFGSRFVVWAVKRNLPVPNGGFLWLRFLFWWPLSVMVSFGVYAVALFVAVFSFPVLSDLGSNLEPSIRILGGLIAMGVPYWIGFFKGIDLQVTRWFSA